jgi:hypothetical protein
MKPRLLANEQEHMTDDGVLFARCLILRHFLGSCFPFL